MGTGIALGGLNPQSGVFQAQADQLHQPVEVA